MATAEGLRERKKREMRQRLSDKATELFLARGFDAVRVAEIAEACGVSEKTVFNYFPSKESLLLDRLDTTIDSVRIALADRTRSPLAATLRILDDELFGLTAWLEGQDDPAAAGLMIARFRALIDSTPSLRAHQRDMMDALVGAAAELIADRAGMRPTEPEPQIAATALLGLWRIQFQALRTYLDGTRAPAEVRTLVTADVHRAARFVEAGFKDLGDVLRP